MKVIVLENLFSLASGRRGFGREPYFIAPRDCKPRQRVTKCLHSLYVRSRIAGIHHPFAPPALYHPSARPKRQINLPPDRSARCISDSNILHAICSKDRERERESCFKRDSFANNSPLIFSTSYSSEERGGASATRSIVRVHRLNVAHLRLNLRLVRSAFPLPSHLAGRDLSLTFEIARYTRRWSRRRIGRRTESARTSRVRRRFPKT